MKITVRKIHDLKTWPIFFQAIVDGVKTFELRKDDRGFEVGDALFLREYSPETQEYTGRQTLRLVVYKLGSGLFAGVSDGYCIMGLSVLPQEVTVSDDTL